MKFIYPGFLWALFLVLVPIIIHLVNFRRHQTVYFSNVSFLKKVKKESQRKSKLKQLLILACRVLLLAAMVLAFSKPYIPSEVGEQQQANKVVCIYIDNSFSMSAEGPEGIALESARQKAYAIVNASLPDTKFALLTNNLEKKHFRFYTRQEIIQLIEEVELSHLVTPLSTIVLRLNGLLNNFLFSTQQLVYLISDFQRNSSDLMNLQPDSVTVFNFVPVEVNNVPNLYIDSCWFESPAHHVNRVEELFVSIVNDSDNEYAQLPVNFFLNDSLKALSTLDLKPKEKATVKLQYTNLQAGIQRGRIELSDYPVIYDNRFFISYRVDNKLKTLLIYSNGKQDTRNIEALFLNDEYIGLDKVTSDRLQISRLPDYSAIIVYELQKISTGLCDELSKYVETGGTMVFVPSFFADTASYNCLFNKLSATRFIASDTVKIPVNHFAFDDIVFRNVFKKEVENVDLPAVKYRYRFNQGNENQTKALLSFADNTAALSFSNFKKGKVYVFSFPLSEKENEFVNHLLFVPTLYNMVLYSQSSQNLFYVLRNDRFFEVKSNGGELLQNPVVRNVENNTEFVQSVFQQGGSRIRLGIGPEFEAGIYEVLNANDVIGEVAFNYDLHESELNYYKAEEIITFAKQAGIEKVNLLEQKTSEFEGAVRDLGHGKKLWTLFIGLALLFLLLEIAIIKFWDYFF